MNLISKKFQEWTADRKPLEARISIFEHIRDIPYAVVHERNLLTAKEEMLEQNRGSCTAKHVLLGTMYEKLSIPIRYVSHIFKWIDFPVKYPDDLKQSAQKMPICDHLFCQALLEGRWISVDATWDFPLEKSGLAVNRYWDGHSDTNPAVRPLKEIIHPSIEDRTRLKRAMVENYTSAESAIQHEFYRRFNEFLESFRR